MPDLSQPISFRLPAVAARRLAERAAEQRVSCGELAKRLILDLLATQRVSSDAEPKASRVMRSIQRLRKRELRELKESLNGLHDRLDQQLPSASGDSELLADLIHKLRADFATATAALLVQAGKASVKEARDWVEKNLRSVS